MKVTCTQCSRRVKIKPGREYSCRCGAVLDPFPEWDYASRFASLRCGVIREITDRFFDRYRTEGDQIVDFLLGCAGVDDTRIMALLTAVEIIRTVNGTGHIILARRIVERWPVNHKMRYMLSNCLALSDERKDRIESLKQRIIGMHLEYGYMRKKGANEDEIEELRKRFLQTMDWTGRFISGEERYPSIHIERLARSRVDADNEIYSLLERLGDISHAADLPPVFERETTTTCVVDTNAISNRYSSRYFSIRHIRFIAPEEVLLELSRWDHIEWAPMELDHIEFLEVKGRIPPEIDTMYSRRKGKEPSLADKKVAVLALNERASAIVSADKDLLDTDLEHKLEKHYGLHLDVVPPDRFHRWVERIEA